MRAFLLILTAALSVAAPGNAMPRSVMGVVEGVAPPNPEHIPLKVGNFGSAIAFRGSSLRGDCARRRQGQIGDRGNAPFQRS